MPIYYTTEDVLSADDIRTNKTATIYNCFTGIAAGSDNIVYIACADENVNPPVSADTRGAYVSSILEVDTTTNMIKNKIVLEELSATDGVSIASIAIAEGKG